MALFSGAVLFATGLGPLCSGYITQYLGWRWVFYIQIIYCFVVLSMVALFFRESRGTVLLSRKAALLNQWMEDRESAQLCGFEMPVEGEGRTESQRIRWRVKSDEERETLGKTIWISLYRPFHLLFTEPVVFWFSLWVAFAWAVLYLTFAAVPVVFKQNHGFDVERSGSVFAAMCIGSILATILSIYQEKIARRCGRKFNTPEGRLYFACAESALLPIGLFWFGWTSFPRIHWIVPAIAIGCATMGIFSIYLAVSPPLSFRSTIFEAQPSVFIIMFHDNWMTGRYPPSRSNYLTAQKLTTSTLRSSTTLQTPTAATPAQH